MSIGKYAVITYFRSCLTFDDGLFCLWKITFGCRDKLVIAPYGLDKSTWDPSTDYFLPENFNAENMNGKAFCKAALLQKLGLSEHSSTILVSGSSLAPYLFATAHDKYMQ